MVLAVLPSTFSLNLQGTVLAINSPLLVRPILLAHMWELHLQDPPIQSSTGFCKAPINPNYQKEILGMFNFSVVNDL